MAANLEITTVQLHVASTDYSTIDTIPYERYDIYYVST